MTHRESGLRTLIRQSHIQLAGDGALLLVCGPVNDLDGLRLAVCYFHRNTRVESSRKSIFAA